MSLNEFAAEDLLRIAAMNSAHDLQRAALHYNWDDGFDVPYAIANHPRCDLAVALELFWLSDAVEVHLDRHRISPASENWVRFFEFLMGRLMAGRYERGEASFVPDLSRVEMHKYKKLNVPDLFLSEVVGYGHPRLE